MSPSLTAEELGELRPVSKNESPFHECFGIPAYQMEIAKPRVFITHIDNLPVALKAAASVNQQDTPIIVIDAHKAAEKIPYPSLEDLVQEGVSLPSVSDIKLRPGEAKTKIAFLCFSSGTTGKPKALIRPNLL